MAYVQRNEYDIKKTGRSVTVADNDVAKFTSLSEQEQRLVFVLCGTLSPDLFDDKCIFQSDALCGDTANEFYEIGQVKSQLLAVQSIVIAGRTRQVNKIMTYKPIWMKNYYIDPMLRLARRFSPAQRQQAAVTSRRSKSRCI
ncbi:unnamed protein product, partial [Didymodactylos carnosus]